MTNLYNETISALNDYSYSLDDIKFVCGNDFSIPVEEFVRLAKETDYDNGYGAQEVAHDLLICMKDGNYFVRGEYDGSEWWEFISVIIKKPPMIEHIDRLVTDKIGWDSLKEINKVEIEDA